MFPGDEGREDEVEEPEGVDGPGRGHGGPEVQGGVRRDPGVDAEH